MFSTSRSRSSFIPENASSKRFWIGVAALAISAVGIGISYPYAFTPNPIDQPLIPMQKSRASGFTMKGEAIFQKATKSSKAQLYSRMFATGPMHDAEVIRMEGLFSLITPNGKEHALGSQSWTFSENLKAYLPISKVPAGSKVKITGTVYVYHRELIKSEREMMADGTIKLYMNTGTVAFRKVLNSKPPKLEVECLDLASVHEHGLELMGPDKKTVSNRILLMKGKQLIERATLPYLGKKLGMEPYLIRQLIPKRKEPVTLVLSIQSTGS